MATGQQKPDSPLHARPALQLLASTGPCAAPAAEQQQWLAIALPHLALDARQRGHTGLLLLSRQHNNRRIVHDAATALRQQGIQAGQALSSALALLDRDTQRQCHIQEYDAEREQRELAALGQWALRYTSQVTLNTPNGLTLEIGGSLKLFGGLGKLRQTIEHDLHNLGLYAHVAIAPTALGAEWLAQSDRADNIHHSQALRAALSTLPMRIAVDSERDYQRLYGLGMRKIGDLLRLPRTGLNRRLSQALGLRLERAFGQQPDPRRPIQPRDHFDADLLLPDDIGHAPLLSIAGDRLLQQLQGFLRGRQLSTQRLLWRLHHRKQPPTLLICGTDTPSNNPDRWLKLLDERLAQTQLPAPVFLLQLQVQKLLSHSGDNLSLFEEASSQHSDASAQLLERLRSRLGERAVGGLRSEPRHKPEHSWRFTPPHADNPKHPQPATRPLWLFKRPRLLKTRQQQPYLNGPLSLHSPAERLESEWWTEQPVNRDYFTARDARGRELWVYQDRKSGQWYWHGIF